MVRAPTKVLFDFMCFVCFQFSKYGHLMSFGRCIPEIIFILCLMQFTVRPDCILCSVQGICSHHFHFFHLCTCQGLVNVMLMASFNWLHPHMCQVTKQGVFCGYTLMKTLFMVPLLLLSPTQSLFAALFSLLQSMHSP